LLLVLNDDYISPARGFGMHGHRDMEIVTWVLAGELEHRDSEGNHGRIVPGLAQRMSAGTGIRHSEVNASPDTELHLLQMWVLPDTQGVRPGYQEAEIGDALDDGALHTIAAGDGSGALHINQRGAQLQVARLNAGGQVTIADAPFGHVFVARGAIELEGGDVLQQGDAARLTDAGARALIARDDHSEVVVWTTV
jgi:redox-sensitive bicupin YhaK (pirin superfamily)